MTARRLITVMCDAPSCGQWWENSMGDNAAEARRGLRGSGWALAVPDLDGHRVRLDFCPEHAQSQLDSTPTPATR